jgi:para-nitrobenzyl esterase
MKPGAIARRTVLGGALAAPAIRALPLLAFPTGASAAQGTAPDISSDTPAIETRGGKVRGIAQGEVLVFKGIPYAGAPVGDHRFARAPQITPWTGVREALNYGPACPVPARTPRDRTQSIFSFLLPDGERTDQSEDCLHLNIWAPRDRAGGRPVMVWLHAGGFREGFAQQYAAANGAVIAGRGDAVVVSLNHRLGPLGHLDLSHVGDPAVAESGNAGMLDIVDALHWIRDNIAAFGGDPGNVTLFGQSGGGYKISVLRAMPEACGLFHRAIIQSGARLRVHDAETTRIQTDLVIREFDQPRDPGAIAALRAMPVGAFLQGIERAMARDEAHSFTTPRWSTAGFWFEPVAGTAAFPHQPGAPESMQASRHIPLMVGSNRNEISLSGSQPEIEMIGWDGVEVMLAEDLGANAGAAIARARTAFPHLPPVEILSILKSRRFRVQAFEFARRAAEAGNRQVFNYEFAWQTPLFAGRPRAFHGSEVAFVFDTLDLIGRATGAQDRALSREISARWCRFAADGVPTVESGAPWPRVSPEMAATMVLDATCVAGPAADLDLIQFLLDNDVTGQRHHA